MKIIELVFTKSRKKLPIGSWLIRLWTGKSYSHVARKCRLKLVEKPLYYQANDRKVNYEYEEFFLKNHVVVKSYKIEIPESNYKQLVKESWRQVGAKYGCLQNIGIALVDLFKLFGKKIDNPWKKGLNCSELMFVTVFSPMFPDLKNDPNTIKPHHIEKIIQEKFYGR